jgi:transcriptional regulator with XRE-family HTH domain
MEKPARSPRPALARLRRDAGLSQQQLAAALGLKSSRAVKAWENGEYAPSMMYALPLARVLGVSLQVVVETVAGPDPGLVGELAIGANAPPPGSRDGEETDVRLAGTAGPQPLGSLPPETLASVRFHITELARLVGLLQTAPPNAAPRELDGGEE